MTETDAACVDSDLHAVFVIDDDVGVSQFISMTLANLGIKADVFRTAKEALAALDRGHPALIFLDVALIQSDAIDVLRGLGERRYGGVVQVMSGGNPSLLQAVQRIGARHGMTLVSPLQKPFRRDAIIQLAVSLGLPDSPGT
jgi:DNA-binding NtrC family response regulator